MNKILVVAGIIIVAVAKVVILKFVLFDLPAYDRCLAYGSSLLPGSSAPGCAEVSIIPFVVGWILVAAGAGVLIYGLKADSIPKSRLV
jgi:hypothetical protein